MIDYQEIMYPRKKKASCHRICYVGYMYPQNNEYFRATDSGESAGIAGMSVNQMKALYDMK